MIIEAFSKIKELLCKINDILKTSDVVEQKELS